MDIFQGKGKARVYMFKSTKKEKNKGMYVTSPENMVSPWLGQFLESEAGFALFIAPHFSFPIENNGHQIIPYLPSPGFCFYMFKKLDI